MFVACDQKLRHVLHVSRHDDMCILVSLVTISSGITFTNICTYEPGHVFFISRTCIRKYLSLCRPFYSHCLTRHCIVGILFTICGIWMARDVKRAGQHWWSTAPHNSTDQCLFSMKGIPNYVIQSVLTGSEKIWTLIESYALELFLNYTAFTVQGLVLLTENNKVIT